ncbi:MAG: hypothetical protein JXQ81_06955 [Desulfuromonadales bacterium]|nr:hypothetical protein [Desulfuromonadales bacterium]MBN2792229.1 hypothetical protein [Desulfuromonadales bacterium]
MKNIVRIICSLIFATSVSLPADVSATEIDETESEGQEIAAEAALADQYQLSLVVGEHGLLSQHENGLNFSDSPLIFVSDPRGKIVKDAQVVTTLVAVDGNRTNTRRAWPFRGGYLVPTHDLAAGRYFVEAEIVTDGRLLTDLFVLEKTAKLSC